MRDDIEFNIKFCELVEKYPVLYDYNRSDYCNRNVQDRIWEVIAKELNESAGDCRDRWKNIRGRYGKVVKLQVSGLSKKKVKEYYLGPYLHFLDGFLKSRPRKGKVKQEDTGTVVETVYTDDNTSDNEEESNHSIYLPKSTERNSVSPTNNQSNYGYNTPKKQKLYEETNDIYDTDLCFLKSLLPDMMDMSPVQKRRFKIGVLNLAGQILDGNETVTSD